METSVTLLCKHTSTDLPLIANLLAKRPHKVIIISDHACKSAVKIFYG